MQSLLYDIRYGFRTVRRHPAFALVATITLSLAIGVNAAIFSLVNAIVFADLPMTDADRVVILRSVNPRLNVERGGFSLGDYIDFTEQAQSFSQLAAWRGGEWTMTGAGDPTRVEGYEVTPNFLDTWGLPPEIGRGFLPEEGALGGPPVVMLSHGFWERQFGARPDVLGSTIRLGGTPHTIVGIVSPRMEFGGLGDAEVWKPMQIDRGAATRDERRFFVSGRLAPTASVARADRELKNIAERLAETYPATNRDWSLFAQAAPDSMLNEESKIILFLLSLTVGFVLLIACANIANMLLARASARERELAVRAALGAARSRVIRQLLTESMMIAVLSAGFGLALSRLLMWSLTEITGGEETAFQMAVLDGNVLLFTIGLAVAAPVVFGLLPALKASGLNLGSTLREGGVRSGGARRGKLLRSSLVGTQVALAVMLMIVATLMTRTVINLQDRELGFEPAGTLVVRLRLPDARYPTDDAQRQFFEEAKRRLEALSSVEQVALASRGPTSGGPNRSFEIAGREAGEDIIKSVAGRSSVTPGYFALTRIPVFRGREFELADNVDGSPVAVVSQEAVTRYWPNEDPMGARLRFEGADSAWYEVIGVVGDLRVDGETERAEPQVYLSEGQSIEQSMLLILRSHAEPELLAKPVRDAIWGLDPEQPIDDVRSYEQMLKQETASMWAIIALFGSFAIFALIMAAVGIYGVMSYSVAQRTGEIGIRMALGASQVNVRRMVLGQGVRLLVVGGVVGLLGAAGLSRMLASLVFGMRALDPITFIGVPLILGAVGLIANFVPAVRATRISPINALRME